MKIFSRHMCVCSVVAWGAAEDEAGHWTILLTIVLSKHATPSRYNPALATITNSRTQRARGRAGQTFEISLAVDVLWLCSYVCQCKKSLSPFSLGTI